MRKDAVFLRRGESWLRQEGLRHKDFDAITTTFALRRLKITPKADGLNSFAIKKYSKF